MKKFIFLLFFISLSICSSAGLYVDSETYIYPMFKHQIGFHLGRLSYNNLAQRFYNRNNDLTYLLNVNNLSFSGYENENSYQFLGPYILEYKYFLDPRFSIGTVLSYEKYSINIDYYDQVRYSRFTQTRGKQYFSAFVNINVNYYHSEWCDFYGSFYGGICLIQEIYTGDFTKNKPYYRNFTTFQVDPVGLRIGKAFSGHISLGIGSLSLLKIGISYRFQKTLFNDEK